MKTTIQSLQQYGLECPPMTNDNRTVNIGNEIKLYVIC